MQSYAVVKASPSRYITSGRKSFWKLASADWLETQREVVAEQAVELRLLKKSMIGDGGDPE